MTRTGKKKLTVTYSGPDFTREPIDIVAAELRAILAEKDAGK